VPAAKNTLSRYQVINACFLSKSKKYWSQKELLQRLKESDLPIASRTLRDDINTMRFDDHLQYHAPIKYSAINKGYYYTDPEYSINRIRLNSDEVDTLLTSVNIVKAYESISILQNFQSIVTKIVSHVNRQMLPDKHFVPEIESYCYIPQAISKLVNYFIEAIRKKEVLNIFLKEDTDLYKKDRQLFLHPYTLSIDQQHWYITGLRDSDNMHIFLQLDWIGYAVRTDKHYIPFRG
jgi:predicted DNA-binding transcriptional regulator YafY